MRRAIQPNSNKATKEDILAEKHRQLCAALQSLKPEGWRHIYSLVKNIKHSVNSHGYYFDVSTIPNEILDTMIKYANESQNVLQEFLQSERERIGLLKKIRSTIIPDPTPKYSIAKGNPRRVAAVVTVTDNDDDDAAIDDNDNDGDENEDVDEGDFENASNAELDDDEDDDMAESERDDDEQPEEYSVDDIKKSTRKIWSSVYYSSGSWGFAKKQDPDLKRELQNELKIPSTKYKSLAQRRKTMTVSQKLKSEPIKHPDLYTVENDTDDEDQT
jgi:hypothetical protein